MSFILSVVWNGMPVPEEPASPDSERMDAISGALAHMVQRQDELLRRQEELAQHQEGLERRLLRIEAAVGLAATPPPGVTVPAPP